MRVRVFLLKQFKSDASLHASRRAAQKARCLRQAAQVPQEIDAQFRDAFGTRRSMEDIAAHSRAREEEKTRREIGARNKRSVTTTSRSATIHGNVFSSCALQAAEEPCLVTSAG